MDDNLNFSNVMFSEEQIKQRIKELGKQISEDFKGEEILVVGILKGAVLFLSDLIREINVVTRIDFMAVTSYGASTKSTGVVRILKDLDTGIEDLNVIIVEDIIDTGITLHYLRDYLNGRLPKSLKICTLLDKPERREVEIEPDYTGFKVGNKFIIGYGLDLDQKYRNLPYITCIEES